jgi:hypothetical protein
MRPRFQQRQRGFGEGAHRPQHVAPRQPHRGEGIGAGERENLPLAEAAAPPQVGRVAIGRGAPLDHALDVGFLEAADLPEAQPQRVAPHIGLLQGAVPVAGIDVGRPHLDVGLTRIARELRRRVEAHRLGVE